MQPTHIQGLDSIGSLHDGLEYDVSLSPHLERLQHNNVEHTAVLAAQWKKTLLQVWHGVFKEEEDDDDDDDDGDKVDDEVDEEEEKWGWLTKKRW